MKYQKWNIGVPREGAVAALREAGYPYLMALVLAARGVASPERAAEFLDRDRKLTLSPMPLPGERPLPSSGITTWTASPPPCW